MRILNHRTLMLLAAVAITMSPQSADAQYPHPSSFQQYSSAPAQTYVPPSYGQAPTQNGQAPTQNGRIQYGQTQAPYGQVQSQYGQTNGQYSRQQNPYSRPQVMHSQPRSMQSRPQVMHNQPGISGATANQNSNQPAYSPYGPSMARPWRPTYHAPQSQQGAMPVSQTLGPQLNGLSSVKSPGPNAIPYQVPAPNYRPGPNYGPSTNYGSIDWGGTAGGCNGCGSGGCGSGGCNEGGCAPRCSNRWYGSIAPITMTRNRPPRLWTSYETGNNPNQILHTQHAEADWGVGGEIVLGYCLPCWCDWSIEFSYWGLEPLDGSASITHANMVSTPVDVAGIEFGTVNGTVLFDSAAEHRIWRRNEIHNFEVNLVQGRCGSTAGCGGCGGAWDTGFMFGARIFSFDENLIWGSLNTGGTWGGNGGLDEAYVDVDVENLLAGFQVGFDVGYNFGRCWRMSVAPKFGVYNNHIEQVFHIRRGDGTVATPTTASGVTGAYPVRSDKNVISFLSEVDMRLEWQFSRRWNAFVGYRIVAVTGIALADNQIPPYLVDIPEIADIDHNAGLVLHGARAGIGFKY